ncbi:MAG TPA: hypothetical protein PK398_01500 [Candidatus Gracilibacteria bacterium]|nr:hypothetical protein [Candidatus Gracilibacteria bacterium]
MTLTELIQKSVILTDKEKQFYIFIVPFLSEKLVKKLQDIFEREQKSFENVEEKYLKQKTESNRKFLEDLKNFYEQEYKKESQNEEKKEKDKAEDLLKKLNT